MTTSQRQTVGSRSFCAGQASFNFVPSLGQARIASMQRFAHPWPEREGCTPVVTFMSLEVLGLPVVLT